MPKKTGADKYQVFYLRASEGFVASVDAAARTAGMARSTYVRQAALVALEKGMGKGVAAYAEDSSGDSIVQVLLAPSVREACRQEAEKLGWSLAAWLRGAVASRLAFASGSARRGGGGGATAST
jgi:hypothetical protein